MHMSKIMLITMTIVNENQRQRCIFKDLPQNRLGTY